MPIGEVQEIKLLKSNRDKKCIKEKYFNLDEQCKRLL